MQKYALNAAKIQYDEKIAGRLLFNALDIRDMRVMMPEPRDGKKPPHDNS